MAGSLGGAPPLGSTASSASTTDPTPADRPAREPPHQKAALVAALLAVGDLDHALFILSRFPHLVGINLPYTQQTIADELLRIADHMLQAAYDALPLPWRKESETMAEEAEEGSRPSSYGGRRARYSTTEKRIVAPSAPRALLSAFAQTKSTSDSPLVFFFEEWRNRLPAPAEPLASIEEALKLLRYIGAFGARHSRFFHRLIRVGVHAVTQAISVRSSPARCQNGSWLICI